MEDLPSAEGELAPVRQPDEPSHESSTDLYAQLQEIDPALAAYVHPANRRRIQAGLQYFQQTG